MYSHKNVLPSLVNFLLICHDPRIGLSSVDVLLVRLTSSRKNNNFFLYNYIQYSNIQVTNEFLLLIDLHFVLNV